jgi:hypothetical protein
MMSQPGQCPNGCDEMPMSHPTTVDPEPAAEYQAEVWSNRTGVSGATVADVTDTAITVELEIDQQEYETVNFFKHRDVYEGDPEFAVYDVEDGTVRVEMPVYKVEQITVLRCQGCGTLFDERLGTIENGGDA